MLKKTHFADSSMRARFGKTAFIAGCGMALVCVVVLLYGLRSLARNASESRMTKDPFLALMTQAAAHAKQHGGRYVPALSPDYETLLGPKATVHVKTLQAAGFAVVPWTVDDTETMRALLDQHVDGIISDRPDLLAAVLKEARQKAAGDAAQLAYLDRFDAQGHRGGRGLRPENTLPAFEAGLDNGINSIETDTGVTTDRQSLIWHDQFLNPQSCRRADGQPYTLENRVYIHDISMVDAQRQFICDKLHFGPDQKNDLALSPVSVAFAAQEQMISPYAPTNVAQLFRFVEFYARWYRSGAGKSATDAAVRARAAERVHFNLETKILPPGYSEAKMAADMHGVPETAAVPARVKFDEAKQLRRVGGRVRAYHLLLRRKSHADRRQRQIVFLLRAEVQLLADELPLRIGHGDVMNIDAVLQRIGLAVGAAAGLRIEKLVMPDQRLAVGRHSGIGLDGVDAVVQARFKCGQGVLRAQSTPAAVSLRVKAIQIGELRRIASRLLARFFQHSRQKIGAVRDDSIHMLIEKRAHGLRVVNRPRHHGKSGGLQGLDMDGCLRP